MRGRAKFSVAAAVTAGLASWLVFSCSNATDPAPDPLAEAPIVINEFLCSNDSSATSIKNEKGEYEDWIELYNPSSAPFGLLGLYLSDDSTDLKQFALADTTIPSHGYYLVWADKEAKEGKNHAPFKLGATDGDEIILSTGSKAIIDRISFFPHNNNPEARLPNVSYGRTADGASTWSRQSAQTPGATNAGP